MPGIESVVDSLSAIVELIKTEGLANAAVTIAGTDPPKPLVTAPLLLLSRIFGNAGDFDALGVQEATRAAIAAVLLKILADVPRSCGSDPMGADAVLFRPLQIFPDAVLEGLDPPLARPLQDAAAGCRVRIEPEEPSVAPGAPLQLTATFVDSAGSRTDFEWERFDGNCGTIGLTTGLFVADASEGECTVKATLAARVIVGVKRRDFYKTALVTVCGPPATQGFGMSAVSDPSCEELLLTGRVELLRTYSAETRFGVGGLLYESGGTVRAVYDLVEVRAESATAGVPDRFVGTGAATESADTFADSQLNDTEDGVCRQLTLSAATATALVLTRIGGQYELGADGGTVSGTSSWAPARNCPTGSSTFTGAASISTVRGTPMFDASGNLIAVEFTVDTTTEIDSSEGSYYSVYRESIVVTGQLRRR